MAGVFYLDTSALVRRYNREPGTPVLNQLLDNPQPDELFYISSLVLVEFSCLLGRRVAVGLLSEGVASVVLGHFFQDLEAHKYRVKSVDDDLLSRAVPNGRRYKLRSLDAIHLAIASDLFADAGLDRQKVMVSADLELLSAAESAGFKTLNPTAGNALAVLAFFR